MAKKPIEERLFLRNGVWCVHGYAHGKPWNKSTGFAEADRDQAIARARELEAQKLMAPQDRGAHEASELARQRAQKAQRLTLSQACDQLFAYDIRENSKPKTVAFHAERCASLIRTLGSDTLLATIADRPTLLEYFTRRLDGLTLKQRHTVQKDYRVLRMILRLCQEAGLWEGDLDKLQFDFFRKSTSKYYAPGETWLDEIEYIDALVEEISSGRALVKRGKRNSAGRAWVQRARVNVDRKLHVLTYINLGLRDEELLTIYPHHVSLKNKTVAINFPRDATPDEAEQRKGKTIDAKRVLGLNAVMQEVFKRKLKDADPEKPLFEPWGKSDRDLKAAWRRARQNLIQRRLDQGDERAAKRLNMVLPTSLCLNDLRRTFCSQMAKAGVPLQTCADLLGHTDDTMVKRIYRRCLPSQLQPAMELMPAMALPVVPLKPAETPQTAATVVSLKGSTARNS